MLLKNCAYIVTQNAKREILRNKDVLIEGNIIKKIGNNLKDKEVLDCSNKVVLPGLINTHTHLGMHSLKGLADEGELFEWLQKIKNAEDKLTEEDVYQNTLAGAKEALRFGTTTVYDSYKFTDARIRALEKAGIRALISSTVKDEKSLEEAKKLLNLKHPLIKPVLSVHSLFETKEDIIRKVIDLSNKHQVIRRIHIAETRKERFDCQGKTGKLPIEYLDSLGFLDEKALLTHAIWITKGEIRLIAKKNAKVSHNPVSNMKLASGGVMPLMEMLEENVIVGLGTDSVVSNNNLDLFEEMKVCALLHRHHRWDTKALSAQKVLDMVTVDAARALGLQNVGSIEEGKLADIVTLEIKENLIPMHGVISNIVFCVNGNDVAGVIVDGKVMLKEDA